MCSLHKGESVSLLSLEESAPLLYVYGAILSTQSVECLLQRQHQQQLVVFAFSHCLCRCLFRLTSVRLCLSLFALAFPPCLLPLPFPFAFCSVCYTENRVSPIHRGESAPPLSLYKGESVLSTRRGECPSTICRGGWQMRHSGVEPPSMYSSGEFNDNEVLYMTQEGPLSIQRIECLLYTEGPCLVFTILIQCMIY